MGRSSHFHSNPATTTSCGCRRRDNAAARSANAPRYDFKGQMLTARELSDRSGINVMTLKYRLRVKKMSAVEAVFPARRSVTA